MPHNELLGLLLLGIGCVDPIVGVIASKKITDPKRAAMVKTVSIMGGAFLVALGGAFYFNVISLS